jgi:hypothetical protein
MDHRRYRSYVFVARVFASDVFTALERDVLLDAAEGLLLARSLDTPEVEELAENVEAALEGLVAGRRIQSRTAVELRERIADCGPQRVALAA